ncbi:MAG: hypothetical protein J7545_00870 [Roseofilum sp. SBFL]|uniref:hypothetical protein n=1 Tax=Roseofilum sp. SID1 TaxID=2821497 RepID=UPI001B20AF68|nr:hypothetical protein [Roseofilum sp. SID1]MBP0040519.1 hypothetical protein [Roseofilum sp. SBFL]
MRILNIISKAIALSPLHPIRRSPLQTERSPSPHSIPSSDRLPRTSDRPLPTLPYQAIANSVNL